MAGMLKLEITHQVKKFIDTLPPKQFRQVVNKALSLMADPEPSDSVKMKGYPFRRADIGEYRIVYRLENDSLKVACIDKRNDDRIYKLINRK